MENLVKYKMSTHVKSPFSFLLLHFPPFSAPLLLNLEYPEGSYHFILYLPRVLFFPFHFEIEFFFFWGGGRLTHQKIEVQLTVLLSFLIQFCSYLFAFTHFSFFSPTTRVGCFLPVSPSPYPTSNLSAPMCFERRS